jgi:hypothetical protein
MVGKRKGMSTGEVRIGQEGKGKESHNKRRKDEMR